MIKTYLIVVTLVFFVEAFIRLQNIAKCSYPYRPQRVTKNEDRVYFMIYLVFVIYGLLAIFVP